MKRLVLSTLIAAITASSVLAVAGSASADNWRRRHYDHHYDHYYDHHRHHHNNGSAIAGGLAAGVIGGLIGGAIVNNSGPRYIDPPPPPPPRCWFEDRRVPNAYDGGWHRESIRVCR
jgi:Ni/Co efflux regulator RcnB